MDPSRLLLFLAFLGGLFNIGLYVTKDQSLKSPLIATQIEQDLGFQDVATGRGHACGLGESGSVWCWGEGFAGQLGHARFTDSDTPVPVPLPEPAVSVDAGGATSCAIGLSGTTYCWGAITHGQLGISTPASATAIPHAIPFLPFAIDVAIGNTYICITQREAGITCWGEIQYSEGDKIFLTNPEDRRTYATTTMFTQISASPTHLCALDIKQEAYCWGHTNNGVLGFETDPKVAIQNTPQRVAIDAPLYQIRTAPNHSCGLNDTTLWCWGKSTAFTPTDTAIKSPDIVATADTLSSIAVGDDWTCLAQNMVQCIGNGQPEPWNAWTTRYGTITQLGGEETFLCGLDTAGTAWCGTILTDAYSLRSSDWEEDLSLGGRWNRLVGLWAKRYVSS